MVWWYFFSRSWATRILRCRSASAVWSPGGRTGCAAAPGRLGHRPLVPADVPLLRQDVQGVAVQDLGVGLDRPLRPPQVPGCPG
jgi:hypothetical protein